MNTIGEHLQCPNVTFAEHVHKFESQLGQSVARKKAIYLDTKFWILLGDGGRKQNDSTAIALLALLKKAVKEDKVFCPLSASSFVELMKQESLSSRVATAKIVDQLSLGVAIVGFKERFSLEVEHLIRSTAKLNIPHPVQHAVWRPTSYVLGLQNVQNNAIHPKDDLAIQKAFFDHLSTISLQEMIKKIGDHWNWKHGQASFVSKMNEQIGEHARELRSFGQAYDTELRGILDEVGDMAFNVARSIVRELQPLSSQMNDTEREHEETRWRNLVYHALAQEKTRHALPSLHVRTSLYASLRWNKGRKFRANDLWDFSHAEAGLAYCSALFTDRPMHTMITQQHLGLDVLYDCHVGWSAEDAIEYVSRVLSGS